MKLGKFAFSLMSFVTTLRYLQRQTDAGPQIDVE